jgi:hypothetical protein
MFWGISFINQKSQMGTWIKTHAQVSGLILFYYVDVSGSVTVVCMFLDFSYILGTMTWICGIIVLVTLMCWADGCNTGGKESREGVECHIDIILMQVDCFGYQ